MSAVDKAPERIWLDLPSFNGAVGFAHPERHRKDGWPEYIRADLAATSAPAEVIDAQAVLEAMEGDFGRWKTCCGCYETVDGQPFGNYPYSAALKCDLGGGCRECGGIGAIWDTTDYADMGERLARGHEASAPAEVEGLVITDEMVDDGLAHYSEGGCCGLGNDERREVVRAILEAAIPAALTALQAENERLRAELRVEKIDNDHKLKLLDEQTNQSHEWQGRAEKAEAVADQLAACIKAWTGRFVVDSDDKAAFSAHAKLREGV